MKVILEDLLLFAFYYHIIIKYFHTFSFIVNDATYTLVHCCTHVSIHSPFALHLERRCLQSGASCVHVASYDAFSASELEAQLLIVH